MEGSRVYLRHVQAGDSSALIMAHCAGSDLYASWTAPFTDSAGFETWFAALRAREKEALIARETATHHIAGLFVLSQISYGAFCSAYLAYHAMAGFTGRGLMTEALVQVARYAFDDLGLHRIEANIQPDNTRSIALARRAGFRREGFSPRYLKVGGVWRDHERWALLADD